MAVIDNLAPSKNKRIKGTSQDWFDVRGISFSKNSKNLAYMSRKISKKKQGMKYNN